LLAQFSLALPCSSKLTEIKKTFEETKLKCAKEDLSYDYARKAWPNHMAKLESCLDEQKVCNSTCEQFEQKSEVCFKKNTASMLDKTKTSVIAAADAQIQAMNEGSACMEATFSECSTALSRTQKRCMPPEEGVFRINDQCDVDTLNLVITLRRLTCESQDPKEVAQFSSDRDAMVEEINAYTKKMIGWGKQVFANLNKGREKCSATHAAAVVNKNKGVQQFMDASKEAFKLKKEAGWK